MSLIVTSSFVYGLMLHNVCLPVLLPSLPILFPQQMCQEETDAKTSHDISQFQNSIETESLILECEARKKCSKLGTVSATGFFRKLTNALGIKALGERGFGGLCVQEWTLGTRDAVCCP